MDFPLSASLRAPTRPISLVGFDADDTLWHSEIHFRAAHPSGRLPFPGV